MIRYACPACDAPQVKLDDRGKVAQHTLQLQTAHGIRAFRGYCTTAIGKDPLVVEWEPQP